MGAEYKKRSTSVVVQIREEIYPLDGVDLLYRIAFKSVKNYNLRVSRTGEVSISVPYGTSLARVRRFLAEHEDFLRRALAQMGRTSPSDRALAEQNFSDGAELRILDCRIILRLIPVEHLANGAFAALERSLTSQTAPELWTVYYKQSISEQQRTSAIARVVISEEIKTLEKTVRSLLPMLSERIALAAEEICYAPAVDFRGKATPSFAQRFPNAHYASALAQLKFREMNSRWGSCSVQKGIVTLNSKLIFSTKDCVEYVLCHELCHFYFADHSQRFYALLNAVMPNAATLRKKLQDN